MPDSDQFVTTVAPSGRSTNSSTTAVATASDRLAPHSITACLTTAGTPDVDGLYVGASQSLDRVHPSRVRVGRTGTNRIRRTGPTAQNPLETGSSPSQQFRIGDWNGWFRRLWPTDDCTTPI